jgi:hypothetical protein
VRVNFIFLLSVRILSHGQTSSASMLDPDGHPRRVSDRTRSAVTCQLAIRRAWLLTSVSAASVKLIVESFAVQQLRLPGHLSVGMSRSDPIGSALPGHSLTMSKRIEQSIHSSRGALEYLSVGRQMRLAHSGIPRSAVRTLAHNRRWGRAAPYEYHRWGACLGR